MNLLLEDFASTDFHAHILPDMDHGCVNGAMFEEACERAYRAGIRTICATSHFAAQKTTAEAYLKQRQQVLNRCVPVALRHGIELIPSAEVLLSTDIAGVPSIGRLTVGDSRFMLVEFPFGTTEYDRLMDAAYELRSLHRLHLVLAHPGRFPESVVEKMLEMGCVLQLNVDSFRLFSGRRRSMRYLREGKVLALGSDMHRDPALSYRMFHKAVSAAARICLT